MGGLRGGSNLASWVVAGTLAYYLWIKPDQDLKREQQAKAAIASSDDPFRYVETRKPVPDPQVRSPFLPLLLAFCFYLLLFLFFFNFQFQF